MDLAAILVASLSLVVAALALGWQVASWLLDDARLKTRMKQGLAGRGSVVSADVLRSGKLCDMKSMRDQGWDGPDLIGIEVANIGRRRAKISRVGLSLKRGGTGLSHTEANAWSPSLPHWLEPGESDTWYFELDDARALITATRGSIDPNAGGIVLQAITGTGKTAQTSRILEL